jgi:hypothetical protein
VKAPALLLAGQSCEKGEKNSAIPGRRQGSSRSLTAIDKFLIINSLLGIP